MSACSASTGVGGEIHLEVHDNADQTHRLRRVLVVLDGQVPV